ncbi:MAG TPA: response regulator [Anaerolineae bacterium]|nr:response regulator [Anaerolineae bacterium]
MENSKQIKRILVVDDEPSVAFTFHAALARLDGVEVEMTTDPLEAARMCREQKFDLLMTDYMMPEMDGLELIEEARKELPEIKILIVSAIKQGALAEDAAKENIPWVRYKPIKFNALRELVSSILDGTAEPDAYRQ